MIFRGKTPAALIALLALGTPSSHAAGPFESFFRHFSLQKRVQKPAPLKNPIRIEVKSERLVPLFVDKAGEVFLETEGGFSISREESGLVVDNGTGPVHIRVPRFARVWLDGNKVLISKVGSLTEVDLSTLESKSASFSPFFAERVNIWGDSFILTNDDTSHLTFIDQKDFAKVREEKTPNRISSLLKVNETEGYFINIRKKNPKGINTYEVVRFSLKENGFETEVTDSFFAAPEEFHGANLTFPRPSTSFSLGERSGFKVLIRKNDRDQGWNFYVDSNGKVINPLGQWFDY